MADGAMLRSNRATAPPWSTDETQLAVNLRDTLRMGYWEIAVYLASRGHPPRTAGAIQQHIRLSRPIPRAARWPVMERANG